MLYCFDGGLLLWAAVAAAVALAVKEDQAIFLTIAGVLGWVRFRGTAPGKLALGIGIVSCVVAVHFFASGQAHGIVSGAENTHWQPVRFYAWTGADLHDLLRSGIVGRAGFIVLAFLPLLFLPFRSRMMWLAAAPLAEVLLSRMPTTYTLGTHYAGAWLGYVLVAFAFALRDLDARRARTAVFWCMGLCAVELTAANPMHPGLNLRAVAARDRALDAYLAKLPANADVATQEEAYTHLALDDPRATLLPETRDVTPASCYILLDRDYPASARLEEYGAAVDGLVKNGTYALVDRSGGIELYRKAGDACR